jgi:hypothetical protein
MVDHECLRKVEAEAFGVWLVGELPEFGQYRRAGVIVASEIGSR